MIYVCRSRFGKAFKLTVPHMEETSAAYYRAEAARFREIAAIVDLLTAASLRMLADEFEYEASRLEAAPGGPTMPIG